jgi:hypothetical protein
MMITRRKAVSQVIGFLAMENGLFFAATSATYGMPMVVELGIALDVLVGTLIFRRVLLPHPRDVREPRHPPSREAERALMELLLVLSIPFAGGVVLALWGHRDSAPEVNSAMSFATFLAAAALTARIIADGPVLLWDDLFFVDSFNVFLVALTAFVAFTTSLFSRPYMRIELALGKLTPNRLRLYHSMFQMFTLRCCSCCSPTTSASCGWRWRRRRSRRCCW